MIASMTGYGTVAVSSPRVQGTVSVRSLNHRYLDVNVHLPARLLALEADVRREVQARVHRGRVEVFVQATPREQQASVQIAADAVIASLVGELRRVQAAHGLSGDVTVSDLVRLPGVVQLGEPLTAMDEGLGPDLLQALGQALDALAAMRGAEGAQLEAELRGLLDTVEAAAGRLEAASAEGKAARREVLAARVRGLREEIGPEDPRLLHEIVRLVERHDLDEELQRLRSHVAQARGLLDGGEPCGKQLDFLAQEMAREANTIGSKAASAGVVQEVVALKSAIERVREQVQNVE